jgi:hypothetical protein
MSIVIREIGTSGSLISIEDKKSNKPQELHIVVVKSIGAWKTFCLFCESLLGKRPTWVEIGAKVDGKLQNVYVKTKKLYQLRNVAEKEQNLNIDEPLLTACLKHADIQVRVNIVALIINPDLDKSRLSSQTN